MHVSCFSEIQDPVWYFPKPELESFILNRKLASNSEWQLKDLLTLQTRSHLSRLLMLVFFSLCQAEERRESALPVQLTTFLQTYSQSD